MSYTETRNYLAIGNAASGTTAATEYPLPTGIPYGARLILEVESTATKTISNANGGTWTQIGTHSVTGSVVTAFEAKYVPGMGNPSCAADSDHQTGRMVAFAGSINDPDVVCYAVVASGEDTSDTSWSISGITTNVNNSMVVVCATRANDSASTSAFSVWTNASLASITEAGEFGTTNGNGGGGVIAYGVDTTAGTVNATTVTNATATVKAWVVFAMAPATISEIKLRQYIHGTTQASSGASAAVTFSGAVLAGSSIYVEVGCLGSSATVTVTDSVNSGNYTLVTQASEANGYTTALYVYHNSAAGTPTVTAAFSPAQTYRCIGAKEIANVDLSQPMPSPGGAGQDQAAPTTATDACTSGNVSIGSGNHLVLGITSESNTETTAAVGTGFTIIGAAWNTTGGMWVSEQKRITSGSTTAATFTAPTNVDRTTLCAVFREYDPIHRLNATSFSAASTFQSQTITHAVTGIHTLTALSASIVAAFQQQGIIYTGSGPVLGVHVQAYKINNTGGGTLTTAARTTQATGSVVVTGAGIQWFDDTGTPPSDASTYNNTYTEITSARYPNFNESGIKVWAGAISGGANHTWTKSFFDGNESTIAAVEVKGANSWSTPVTTQHASGTQYTASITVPDGTHVLLCFLHTEGFLTGDSTAAGWTLIEEYYATSNSIQQSVFARTVTGAGATYQCVINITGASQVGITSILRVSFTPTSRLLTAISASIAVSAQTQALRHGAKLVPSSFAAAVTATDVTVRKSKRMAAFSELHSFIFGAQTIRHQGRLNASSGSISATFQTANIAVLVRYTLSALSASLDASFASQLLRHGSGIQCAAFSVGSPFAQQQVSRGYHVLASAATFASVFAQQQMQRSRFLGLLPTSLSVTTGTVQLSRNRKTSAVAYTIGSTWQPTTLTYNPLVARTLTALSHAFSSSWSQAGVQRHAHAVVLAASVESVWQQQVVRYTPVGSRVLAVLSTSVASDFASIGATHNSAIGASSFAGTVSFQSTQLRVTRRLAAMSASVAATWATVSIRGSRMVAANTFSVASSFASVLLTWSPAGEYRLEALSSSVASSFATQAVVASRRLVADAIELLVEPQEIQLGIGRTLQAQTITFGSTWSAQALLHRARIGASSFAVNSVWATVIVDSSGALSITGGTIEFFDDLVPEIEFVDDSLGTIEWTES